MALIKVYVRELEQGMYVAELDRPWLQTPLPFQGFFIRDRADIEELARHCNYVYIDVNPEARPTTPSPAAAGGITISHDRPALVAPAAGSEIPVPRPGRYQDAVPMEEELARARQVRQRVASVVNDIMDVARSGRAINSEVVRETVGAMIDSILRNPDAMAWLTQLRERRSPIYRHAINCSVWMIIFGRALGLDRETLEHLAMIGLLFDVGKGRLPQDLITRRQPLNPEDEALLRRHVEYGVAVLEGSAGIHPQVITGVWSHHERFDGSGYPNRLRGAEIPTFGAMAGIVDWYESSVHPYDSEIALSSIEAIEQLQQMRGTKYQPEIVDQFVQAIGLYPTGTLVELSSGEVGIIVAQNRARRLQPKVVVVTNAAKERLEAFHTIDLLMQKTHGSTKELRIVKSLQMGAYGIDPKELYL